MRALALAALAPVLLACSGARSKVVDDGGEFARHRCVGVAPFTDSRGQGKVVADLIESGLQQMMFDPVDQKVLAEVLAAHPPDRDSGLGLETLERLRAKTPVDAVVFGRIAPDWSMATITVAETTMGAPILQAVLLPRDPKQKAFKDAAELAAEAVRVLASRR